LADDPGYFTWYELMTTDVMAAAAFYRDVVGWGTRESSTSRLPYTLFLAGEDTAAGLMELPEEARRMGAMPRWMGYVGVKDVHATSDRIRRLGGAVYVPPTDTNIGLISVVADPYAASFGLIDQLRIRPQYATESAKRGRVGWTELVAADLEKEFAFYSELFGWQDADDEAHRDASYRAFAAGGLVIGGAFSKHANEPVPFWLLYFNVDDLDAAVERVKAGGGKAIRNEGGVPGGLAAAHCVDPQGGAFALRGKPGRDRKLGWSTEWRGFSSRGQLVAPKTRRPSSNDS
jgi:uncharacterized protein